MPHHQSEPGRAKSPLDIASYARRGPGNSRSLVPAEIEVIARTVRRTPEVMVKVLSHGGQDVHAVSRHFDYLNRKGELDIETDDGQLISVRSWGMSLVEDWDLDLEANRRSANLAAGTGRRSPKLAHKIVFSMPVGTPPEKLLAAVRLFCREEFALKHRYAMVLHTDEPHPHVHVVVKAMSENGQRLNIRKATLREWRSGFAQQLRGQGVPANATARAVRDASGLRLKDGIYRAAGRGQSTYLRERVTRQAQALAEGQTDFELGRIPLNRTRERVENGWREVSTILDGQGNRTLAAEVRTFVGQFIPVRTDNETILESLRARTKVRGADYLSPTC